MQRRGEGSPGPTPLMSAAERGDREAVALLVERGADVNAKEGCEGRTALMGAAGYAHSGVVALLLECGADANIKRNDGWTVLILPQAVAPLRPWRCSWREEPT